MTELNTRISVYDLEGKVVGNIQLDKKIFDGSVNETLLYETKKMYEANKRRGLATAKTRAEVSGGGAKPWRQKGTGRARVGSSRNPLWRHGGVVFAPKPRDFSYSMPKKAIRKALLSSLNIRLKEELIKAIVKIEMSEAKTKMFIKLMDNLKLTGKTLIVVDKISEDVKRSSRNIKNVLLKEAVNINARDVLLNENIIIEKNVFDNLAERLK